MNHIAIPINKNNEFDLIAVWEKDGRKWHLLELSRPQKGIALAQENLKMRLVFPTGLNPNYLIKKNSRKLAKKNSRIC